MRIMLLSVLGFLPTQGVILPVALVDDAGAVCGGNGGITWIPDFCDSTCEELVAEATENCQDTPGQTYAQTAGGACIMDAMGNCPLYANGHCVIDPEWDPKIYQFTYPGGPGPGTWPH